MRNFVFISPNFPENYWRFCKELKNDGFNVLGIGDCPYDGLSDALKGSLNEYYKVSSLENFEEVYRAVAFFIFKYGKIEYLESNNEYWLERDAKLRGEFNIQTGFQPVDMAKVKSKSAMKEYYKKAGVKVAMYCLPTDINVSRKFVKQAGYPVIVKPDRGVGAEDTFKISSDEELEKFHSERDTSVYIMEEFIDAEVNSYDAIIDSHGSPVFETGNVSPVSIMDIVNNRDDSVYYIVDKLSEDVRDAGRRTVKAFGVKSRFVHFEFFRLLSDQRIGKKGEVVALEVNMRPCGGFTPDMMNFANSCDVYKIWADVMAFDKADARTGERFYCAFAGRRADKSYKFSEQEIRDVYKDNLKTVAPVPKALSGAMGDIMYLADFKTKKELDAFYKDVIRRV